MTIAELKTQQSVAINTENYELAHKLKMQIEEMESQTNFDGETETLYTDAPGYTRQASEQFHGSHNTVAQKWEYEGFITERDQIEDKIHEVFPHEVEKIQLINPQSGKKSNHHTLMYGKNELDVSVKKNYNPHTLQDVIALVTAAMEAFGGKIKFASQFDNGHFVSIQPTDKYRRSVFGGADGDSINPRLIIKAGCGGSAFRASLGWFRDVCNNLTWLRSIAVVNESIQHSSKFEARHKDLLTTFSIVAGGWEKTVEFLKTMDQREIRTSALLQELYGDRPAESGRGQTTYDDRIKAIEGILTGERLKLGRNADNALQASSWELFNAIQGYCQHKKNRQGNPSDIKKIVLAGKDTDVLKAERLLFAPKVNELLLAV